MVRTNRHVSALRRHAELLGLTIQLSKVTAEILVLDAVQKRR